jgi:methionyl-tRNA formyltransferase
MLTLDRWGARRAGTEGERGGAIYLADDLRRCGIPYVSVQDHNGRRCVEALRQWGPDLILLLGTRIVRAPVLEAARIGVINLHPGSLPDCRGVDTVEWALFEWRPLSVTAHFADRGVDTGPILVRRSWFATDIRTIPEARVRVSEVAAEVAVEAVMEIQGGKGTPMPQKRGEGRQYFAMHERVKAVVEKRLQQGL